LHVPSYAYWVGCNDTMYDYYKADIMTSTIPEISYILSQGYKVMIYNGQDDLIVNTPGIEAMIDSLNVSGFSTAKRVNWSVDGNIAGYVQTSGNFTFVIILKSGHMAPYDQPVNSKDMVSRFINNIPWTN
jgi:carboxypeptidase C (cathepsin A)